MLTLARLLARALRRLDAAAGTDLYFAVRAANRVGREVAPDRRGRLQLLLAGVALGTRRLGRPVAVRLRGPEGPRRFVLPDSAGMRMLEEVFVFKEYEVPLAYAPRRIVDLGSNLGATILFFATRHPGAEIVGVEASPSLFRLLRANVGDLPNVTLVHAAVSASSEPVQFFEGYASWQGSTRPSDWVDAEHAVWVDPVHLDELLGPGADVLKIDIEGAEFEVLPDAQRLNQVKAVLGEIHAAPDAEETQRILALFEGCETASTPADPEAVQYSTVFKAVRP